MANMIQNATKTREIAPAGKSISAVMNSILDGEGMRKLVNHFDGQCGPPATEGDV